MYISHKAVLACTSMHPSPPMLSCCGAQTRSTTLLHFKNLAVQVQTPGKIKKSLFLQEKREEAQAHSL